MRKVEMCPKCIPLPLEQQISKFWELDSVGVIDGKQSVYDKFESSIKIENNRYEVKLPFKNDCHLVEDNYATAVQRLKVLKKKLDKTPDTLKQYNGAIMQQLNAGTIEKVIARAELGETMYLPHRAVLKERKSIKLRTVFDASTKTLGSKFSLNDCLFTGPCLTPLLYELLIRFRIYNIVVVSDIEKAYLQISVAPEHRDFLRFLWYDDLNSSNHKVEKYKFKHVIFGACCSQYF